MSTQPEVAITIITGGGRTDDAGSVAGADVSSAPAPIPLEQLSQVAGGQEAAGVAIDGPVPMTLEELAAVSAGGSAGDAGGPPVPSPLDQVVAAPESSLPEPELAPGALAGGAADESIPTPDQIPDSAPAGAHPAPMEPDELERAAQSVGPAKQTAAKQTAAKKTTAKKTTAKQTTAKKTTAKKTTAKKTTAKKTAATKRSSGSA
jgi:ribonuclease E